MKTLQIKSLFSVTLICLFAATSVIAKNSRQNSFINNDSSVVGENEEFVQQLVYPNPANEFLYLSNNVEKIDFYDMNGNFILSFINNNSGKIDVKEFKTGIYLTKIFSKTGNVYLYKLAIIE